MPVPVYDKRLVRCRAVMKERGLDTLILTPGAPMRYLTGFSEEGHERLLCLIVRAKSDQVTFITPALNADQARANPAGVADIRPWRDDEGWELALLHYCNSLDLDVRSVGVDDDMPARFVLPIQKLLPKAGVTSAGAVFVDLRSVKTDDEIAAMRKAASLTDMAYHAALAACRPGATEAELARVVESAIRDGGGELSFETIVGSGPNSALPHHGAGPRRIENGEIVLFDLGARVDSYCGDITRVVSIGPATSDAAAIYDIVYRAHMGAVECVQPGVPAESVDAAARKVISDAGYAAQFFHRTGHGIGMECHEAPNIVQGNKAELRPGNCFSVEPGIYLADRFGVRLENIVTVTQTGRRVLNDSIPPKLTDIAELV